jgi:hypothetical protein
VLAVFNAPMFADGRAQRLGARGQVADEELSVGRQNQPVIGR